MPSRPARKPQIGGHFKDTRTTFKQVRRYVYRGGAKLPNVDEPADELGRFVRKLNQYQTLMLHILAAYWYDDKFGPYVRYFYRLIAPRHLRTLAIGRKTSFDTVVNHISQKGFAQNAMQAYDLFNHFFNLIRLRIDEFQPLDDRWYTALYWIDVTFRRRGHVKVTPDHPLILAVDWRDMCQIDSLTVQSDDGYVYVLGFDRTEHILNMSEYFIRMTAFAGTKQKTLESGELGPPEQAIVKAVTITIQVQWCGPNAKFMEMVQSNSNGMVGKRQGRGEKMKEVAKHSLMK